MVLPLLIISIIHVKLYFKPENYLQTFQPVPDMVRAQMARSEEQGLTLLASRQVEGRVKAEPHSNTDKGIPHFLKFCYATLLLQMTYVSTCFC